MRVIKVGAENSYLIQEFLNVAGNALSSFRYFNKRNADVLANHLITLVVIENDFPCAYGHLDKENEKIWLGIAVAEAYQGKGIGKLVMQELSKEIQSQGLSEVFLAVDKVNSRAIKLYKMFGFRLMETHNTYFIFKLTVG